MTGRVMADQTFDLVAHPLEVICSRVHAPWSELATRRCRTRDKADGNAGHVDRDSPTEMSGYGSTNDVATTVEQVGRMKTERQRRARDVNCTRSGASSGAHSPHD